MNKDIFLELLKNKEFKAVRSILDIMNEVDIAELLSDLDDKELIQAFRLIPKSKAADVFTDMSNSMQAYLVEKFSEKELTDILKELYMDDTVDLIEELPANLVSRILDYVDPEKRTQINTLLNYPDDSTGSIMTTEYVNLDKETTVEEALAHIKETGIHKETIYTCYVLENRKLLGIVTAKELLTMDSSKTMEDLMKKDFIYVTTLTDQEETAKLFSKYGLLAIPVVDQQGFMVGIVTVDDAIDVMKDETTEDMELMNALNPSETPYFETSVLTHAKNRIGWLLFLMLSATITQTIIAKYENAFTVLPILVSFIPMLTDTGGNCGSQSSTLIIRGLALDEINFDDLFKVMFKEFRIALIVGTVLSITNGLYIMVRYKDVKVAFLVGISLLATVLMAKIIGSILPLIAKKLHFDPAIMAAPLITTIVDAGSILVYFNIATRLLEI